MLDRRLRIGLLCLFLLICSAGCQKSKINLQQADEKLQALKNDLYQLGVPSNQQEAVTLFENSGGVDGTEVFSGEYAFDQFDKYKYDNTFNITRKLNFEIFTSASQREVVQKQVDEIEDWLDLHVKSADCDYFNYEQTWVDPMLQFNPELAVHRQLSKLSCLRAVLSYEAGDYDKGLHELEANLRVAYFLSNYPTYIHYLSGRGITTSIQDAIVAILQNADLDENEINKLLSIVDRYMQFRLPKRVIIGEAYSNLVHINKHEPLPIRMFAKDLGWEIKSYKEPSELEIRLNEIVVLEFWFEILMSYMEVENEIGVKKVSEKSAELFDKAKEEYLPGIYFVPDLSKLNWGTDIRIHQRNLIFLSAHLRLYKLERGEYPESLHDLNIRLIRYKVDDYKYSISDKLLTIKTNVIQDYISERDQKLPDVFKEIFEVRLP